MDAQKTADHACPMDNSDTAAAVMDLEHSETTDSGVQLLDSESTEMNESMVISGAGFDDDGSPVQPDKPMVEPGDENGGQELTRSDIENSNIPETNTGEDVEAEEQLQIVPASATPANITMEDSMISSQCSTFDANESTVCRRRPKRTNPNPPKKRVSFHEDILKNTKTDNIHIEHGFITYKNGVRQQSQSSAASMAGRYSWCAKGTAGEFQDSTEDPDYVIYRNACSEVLDYGKTDIYDGDGEPPRCDNSGVFEYADAQNGNLAVAKEDTVVAPGVLYQCQCSDSNSSLESNSNSGVDVNLNSVRGNYAQTKSSSCECIGSNGEQPNGTVLTDNCYYSEPNIGTMRTASVWSKEKQPKSSCLKKTKYSSFDQHQQSQEAAEAISSTLRKFNIHTRRNNRNNNNATTTTTPPNSLVSVNNLLDNGKSIFGSLKNIFGMPLPERGVPEGQEDAQAVNETGAEDDDVEDITEPLMTPDDNYPVQASPGSKSRSFLSKSFDGGFHEKVSSPNKKTFIHTVDTQLRKNNGGSPKRSPMARSMGTATPSPPAPFAAPVQKQEQVYRNKFIVNCESTVFEHTGVSYSYEGALNLPSEDPPKQAEPVANTSHSYLTQKISKWTNMFRSSTTSTASQQAMPGPPLMIPASAFSTVTNQSMNSPSQSPLTSVGDSMTAEVDSPKDGASKVSGNAANDVMECSFASSNSTMTDVSSLVSTPTAAAPTLATGMDGASSISTTPTTVHKSTSSGDGFNKIFGGPSPTHSHQRTPTRHLPSPRRRKSSSRHCMTDAAEQQQQQHQRMSPDLFNNYVQLMGSRAPMHDLRTSSLLSEDFDDILTVTTNDTSMSSTTYSMMADRNNEDMVIVDYPEITIPDHPDDSDFLKPASSKSSLINRFLRNVTQKKIMEATIALNKQLARGASDAGQGVLTGRRPVVGQLYVRGVKPMNMDLIEDLNAEIAMEIEQSKVQQQEKSGISEAVEDNERGSPLQAGDVVEKKASIDVATEQNGFGVGEIPLAMFKGVQFPFIGALLPEFLMKVFKLYIGYDREGIMAPVLVFLTNKTLYVTDLVRSNLCNKFVMPYAELDVILLGPYGNTVLLCNGDRDMQQVLLAGGPNQANSLVSSLEICARRGGLQLPSIGQLTLDHLAPLQHFVRDNSKTVDRRERWLYYAVVSISPMTTSGGFTEVQEQLGANINGPLMHRSMSKTGVAISQWSASYFLLKAGVLYMFPTTTTNSTNVHSTQRLPSWAVTLTECQGVRRMMNAGRPHCFELLLRTGALQLAGSDEYAASDWMQALVQSASGLFELEEKRSHYGCTLVLTSSHIITLREDFTEPLKRVVQNTKAVAVAVTKQAVTGEAKSSGSTVESSDSGERQSSSAMSTPSKSMGSVSGGAMRKRGSGSATGELLTSSINAKPKEAAVISGYGKMFSEYGKDSGMEILSCADIGELICVKVSERSEVWWCSLEFSCQECVQENSDVVVHFATESEHERFLEKLKEVWRAKTGDVTEFPLHRVVEGKDSLAEHCTKLFTDINRMWDPLVTAALGYPK